MKTYENNLQTIVKPRLGDYKSKVRIRVGYYKVVLRGKMTSNATTFK